MAADRICTEDTNYNKKQREDMNKERLGWGLRPIASGLIGCLNCLRDFHSSDKSVERLCSVCRVRKSYV